MEILEKDAEWYESTEILVKNEKNINQNTKSVSTDVSEDDNPLRKFKRIKNEIDLIEKDLKFYQENVLLFLK